MVNPPVVNRMTLLAQGWHERQHSVFAWACWCCCLRCSEEQLNPHYEDAELSLLEGVDGPA